MPRRRLPKLLLRCAGYLALLLSACDVVSAETGVVQAFPLPTVRMRSGLTVEVDTRTVSSNGYRSVRVKVSNTPSRNKPAVPVTADRQVRIVLNPAGVGHVSRVKTSKVIEIPEKQTSGEATIPVPTAGDWYQLNLLVYEGGDLLEDVSGPVPSTFFGMRNDSEVLPTLLFVDYDIPDRATRDGRLTLLATRPAAVTDTFDLPDYSNLIINIPYTNVGMGGTPVMPLAAAGTRLTDAQVLSATMLHSKVQLLPPAEMPQQWIELSCFDITFISLADLERMAKEHPRQRRALVDWLHGGPTLVVYGVGNELERLRDVEKLLELAPLPLEKGKAAELRGWTPAASGEAGKAVYQNPQTVVYGGMMASSVTLPATTAAGGSTAAATDLFLKSPTIPFAGRGAGLGWVVAIGHSDPFGAASAMSPASQADWQWLLHSIPDQHQVWSTRHGMSYLSYNQGLWNWYIPGVGAAPVFSFVLLATLFAVLIGPVNYLLLGKIHRLYLLLVTVPLGAAVVTLGLFGYAVLSDGLGVKARIRSFSLLDQESGRAVSWSRQSYYASLVPSQGMLFPSDAVVWPLDERPNVNRQGTARQLNWEKDGQRLRSGYLSSRRLTQLMVTRSSRTKRALQVVQNVGSQPRVTNELGGTVELLILRDRQGNYFHAAKPLAAGNEQTLVSLPADKVQPLLSRMVDDHRRDYPEGYDPVAEERRTNTPWNRAYWGSSRTASMDDSILETNIRLLQHTSELVLRPGMYVAQMEKNPDVPIGVADAAEAESFHVIVGRW